MLVAIASENDRYDGVVYERLLSLLLGTKVERWRTDMRLSGHRAVTGLADPFLRRAAAAGVDHALFAVDNDGGARRGPEHVDEHEVAVQAADDDGCRTCRLLDAVPAWWLADQRHFCAVVPVQTLETWLLWVRGNTFEGEPESDYYRRGLKKRFFGKLLPPEDERASMALSELSSPSAVDRLRMRRSFRLFERQLVSWS